MAPARNTDVSFIETTGGLANLPFWISLGAFAFFGLLISFLIPETMGMTLEMLAGEDSGDGEERAKQPWLEESWEHIRRRIPFIRAS